MPDLTILSPASATLRLVLTVIFTGLIGLEREIHRQPAGLRTHILIGLGSCVLMILSLYLGGVEVKSTIIEISNPFVGKGGDPGRIAAQVVSGIGFLGAGAIIRLGGNIRGLTTAASIWVVAALGMTAGAGMYLTVSIGFLLVLFTLVILRWLEQIVYPAQIYKIIEVRGKKAGRIVESVNVLLEENKIKIRTTDIIESKSQEDHILRFYSYLPQNINVPELHKSIINLKSVEKVSIYQKV